ncbi:hypothetical protein, partial [Bradyrhizobium brasilense]|uniref:hypothetical protein n=1 Tax=Bradyrhizobium brasilense TaxID=1419277 RepID=UPI001E5E4D1D
MRSVVGEPWIGMFDRGTTINGDVRRTWPARPLTQWQIIPPASSIGPRASVTCSTAPRSFARFARIADKTCDSAVGRKTRCRSGQAKRDPGPITANAGWFAKLEPQLVSTTEGCGY